MVAHRCLSVTLILSTLLCESASFHLAGHRAVVAPRHAAAEMKGRGTRGMPGKGVKPPPGSGFNQQSKKRMQRRDFERDEWTLVANAGELGEEIGSTMAVEAGQSPQGQNFIWALVRGPQGAGAAMGDDDVSNVYATDGSCRACSFPMVKGVVEPTDDGLYKIRCPSCGSKYNLETGEVLDWLPGDNPIAWMAKQVNSAKEETPHTALRTRVSQSGRVYVRLPDGTLKITKTAADRADDLASGATTAAAGVAQSAKERVLAAQSKANQ